MKPGDISTVLEKHGHQFHQVIPFNEATDKIVSLNLAKTNAGFTEGIYNDTDLFSRYIDLQRKNSHATYLIGGYREHREMYSRSKLFDKNLATEVETKDEPRTLHLGTDIWGEAGTKIFAPRHHRG